MCFPWDSGCWRRERFTSVSGCSRAPSGMRPRCERADRPARRYARCPDSRTGWSTPDTGSAGRWSAALPESWARWASGPRRTSPGAARARGCRCWRPTCSGCSGPGVDRKELRALSREAMRSYGRYWLEVFRLPVIPVDRLMAGMHETGSIQNAFEYLAAGRGVVFALPHMGNWDQAGAWIIASGAGSFTTVDGAAEAGVGLRAVRRLPREPRHGGAAGQRRLPVRSAYWRSGCGRAGWSACSATGTSPAPASRWISSARRPG